MNYLRYTLPKAIDLQTAFNRLKGDAPSFIASNTTVNGAKNRIEVKQKYKTYLVYVDYGKVRITAKWTNIWIGVAYSLLPLTIIGLVIMTRRFAIESNDATYAIWESLYSI